MCIDLPCSVSLLSVRRSGVTFAHFSSTLHVATSVVSLLLACACRVCPHCVLCGFGQPHSIAISAIYSHHHNRNFILCCVVVAQRCGLFFFAVCHVLYVSLLCPAGCLCMRCLLRRFSSHFTKIRVRFRYNSNSRYEKMVWVGGVRCRLKQAQALKLSLSSCCRWPACPFSLLLAPCSLVELVACLSVPVRFQSDVRCLSLSCICLTGGRCGALL